MDVGCKHRCMVNLFIGEDTTNRMDRWINGWMDPCMHVQIHVCMYVLCMYIGCCDG